MLTAFIRNWIKSAVLSGFNDALMELEGTSETGTQDAVTALRQRLALPAPKTEEARPKRKGG